MPTTTIQCGLWIVNQYFVPWAHVAIANAKTRIANIYHSIKPEFLQRYLNEFCYKFNCRCRYFGERLFDRMLIAATSYPTSFKNRDLCGPQFILIFAE